MTFGDLWRLIERHRVSPDLRVVYYGGRFGLPDNRCTIYNGEDAVVNVPLGDLPIDKVVFRWDDRYSNLNDKIREAAPCVGTILKILKDARHISGGPVVDALIEKSRNPERIEMYDEKDDRLFSASNIEELDEALSIHAQRSQGLIPT